MKHRAKGIGRGGAYELANSRAYKLVDVPASWHPSLPAFNPLTFILYPFFTSINLMNLINRLTN